MRKTRPLSEKVPNWYLWPSLASLKSDRCTYPFRGPRKATFQSPPLPLTWGAGTTLSTVLPQCLSKCYTQHVQLPGGELKSLLQASDSPGTLTIKHFPDELWPPSKRIIPIRLGVSEESFIWREEVQVAQLHSKPQSWTIHHQAQVSFPLNYKGATAGLQYLNPGRTSATFPQGPPLQTRPLTTAKYLMQTAWKGFFSNERVFHSFP